ncbi:MAG: hypothetical protein SGJ27_21920 [Candidatus Melainabacteria bacterium]|nr:hypothetical protein [Candidatus Melainabacteria bacterium]
MNHFSPIAVIFTAILGAVTGMWMCNAIADNMQVRGFELSMADDSQGALVCYDRAIMLNPSLAPAYVNRAQAKRALGDTEAALMDCTKAIECGGSPEFLLMTYTIQGSLKEDLDDKRGAIADYNSALVFNRAIKSVDLRMNPVAFTALTQRGLLEAAVGETKDAIDDLTEVIKIDPTCAQA